MASEAYKCKYRSPNPTWGLSISKVAVYFGIVDTIYDQVVLGNLWEQSNEGRDVITAGCCYELLQ